MAQGALWGLCGRRGKGEFPPATGCHTPAFLARRGRAVTGVSQTDAAEYGALSADESRRLLTLSGMPTSMPTHPAGHTDEATVAAACSRQAISSSGCFFPPHPEPGAAQGSRAVFVSASWSYL